jgi:hypothetical protein
MARRQQSGGGGYWWDAPVWQPFKWTPRNTQAHSGIDLGMPIGSPIVAPFDGTYMNGTVEPWGGQVNYLVQFSDGPRVLSFLHLSQITPHRAGETIPAGALLGYSGAPPAPQYGTGAHLHFEVTHGTVAPYEGYSPVHPTPTSYPMDPSPLLAELQRAGAPIPQQSMPGTAQGQGVIAAVGSVPGFLALAQGIQRDQQFPSFDVTNPVGSVVASTQALLSRLLFVTIGALLFLFVVWNLIARPAMDRAAQASGPAALEALA